MGGFTDCDVFVSKIYMEDSCAHMEVVAVVEFGPRWPFGDRYQFRRSITPNETQVILFLTTSQRGCQVIKHAWMDESLTSKGS